MKYLAAVLLVAAMMAVVSSGALAEQGRATSITVTLDRAVMPVTLYHPGLMCGEPVVVTVNDFAIRNYFGVPIDGFLVQKASATVEIPIETVSEIRQTGWICRNTKDIEGIAYVVPVVITLTDGREVETLMNADFGTIEGFTERGFLFVEDPHTEIGRASCRERV